MIYSFLQLNINNTKILIVGPKKRRQEINSYFSVCSLQASEQIRNLGIILDADLIFQNHITNIS